MIKFLTHHGVSVGRGLASLIFPDKCLKCGIYIRRDPDIPLSASYCQACLGPALPVFQSPFCPCCGHVFSSGEDHLCEDCLKKKPVPERVRAAFEYKGIVREAVALFKYRARLSLAKPFEHHLFQAFETWFSPGEFHLILPIPLHGKKARARGFNQSYFLVRRFPSLYRKKYGCRPPWQVDISSLVRIRHTPSQTGLTMTEREKNLKKAFAWQSGRDLSGKKVLLVDDVYTTGSTCRAAAAALRAAGVDRVCALVLARA